MSTPAHIDTSSVWKIQEVMKFLGVSRDYVYKLIREEGLPCAKLGKGYTFLPDRVHAWHIARHTSAAPISDKERRENSNA